MNCKNCNAVMRVDQARKVYVCPYCESIEPFDGVSKEELQGMLHDAIKDVRKESIKEAEKRLKSGAAYRDERSAGRKVLDVFILIGQIFFCVFLSIFSIGLFIDYALLGLVSVMQLGLMIAAMILKSVHRRTKKRGVFWAKNVCLTLVGTLVIFWFVGLMNGGGSESLSRRQVAWPTQGIGSTLPALEGTLDSAYTNANGFNATAKKVGADEFNRYVELCKEEGFVIDAVASENKYEAYDDNDNKLTVSYWHFSDSVNVELRKALEMIDYSWPSSFEEFPAPKAEKSCLTNSRTGNGTKSLEIYVGDVTREEFMQYMEACTAAGYECSYYGEDSFTARKGLNDTIRVEFQRGRLLYVDIYKKEE